MVIAYDSADLVLRPSHVVITHLTISYNFSVKWIRHLDLFGLSIYSSF